MEEEIIEENVENGNEDYIETIKNLKQNTVPKSEAERLKADNKRLLEALTNGETIEQPKAKEFDEEETISKIMNPNVRDLDYFSNLLALRNYKLETEKIDIFAGKGSSYQPAENEDAKIENVVKCLEHCIEYSDGDPDAFDKELERITIKNIKPRRK